MQAQAMRVYQIAFSGRDAQGVLPMFTRVKAMTGKKAVRAFVERYKPVSGWFLGILRTNYRRRQKERAATRRHEKSRVNPALSTL
ncbi:hypothetical protein RSL75_004274 [Salmonella enterica]|nr:hypothetical protein [Salmonella enterica]